MEGAASLSALLLLALVGGFLFTFRCHAFSYHGARVEGQRLLFVAAGWAVILLVLARLLLLFTPFVFAEALVDGVRTRWSEFVKPVDGVALPTFFVAFLLGPTLAWIVNRFYRPKRAAAQAIEKYGSELEKLIHRAWSDKLLVSVTLDNRKAYVGYPVFTPDPRQSTEDLRLLPVLSGYRDEKDLQLIFTTRYTPVYRLIRNNPSLGLSAADFVIVFAVDKLVSVNLFSLRVDQSLFDMPSAGSAATVGTTTNG